jgi:hypothetical protein
VGLTNNVVHDGNGGAYVVRTLNGIASARHIDSLGNPTWPGFVDVHDAQPPYPYSPIGLDVCPDGDGGFILVHGCEDLFAQRVNAAGNLLWGPNGVHVAADPGIGGGPHPVSIYLDGTGGALIGWDAYWLLPGGVTQCRQMMGARVDAFGTLLWTEDLWHCDWRQPVGEPAYVLDYPHDAVVVGDGSGGGIFAWIVQDESSGDDELVMARGIAAGGGPPTPRLSLMMPDAAQSGQTGTYLILGDYLDLTLGYELIHEEGLAAFTLVPDQMHSYQLLEGLTTLSGLPDGAYHLVVEMAGTPEDTLRFAAGIGPPPTCGDDLGLVETEREVNLEGSQRQSAIDVDGRTHLAWVEHDATSDVYGLHYARRVADEWQPLHVLLQDRRVLRHVTLAADVDGRVHVAVVREFAPDDHRIEYFRLSYAGEPEYTDQHSPGGALFYPVLVTNGAGEAHVVFERDTGTRQLAHAYYEEGGSVSTDIITSGGSPRRPDMAAVGEGLMLTYVRDSLIPGIQQIDFQEYVPVEGWMEPRLLSFGVQMSSPSVAWDGAGRTLFAWIIDNEAVNGIPSLVHTRFLEGETFGDVRARPGAPQHLAVSVASAGPGRFSMLTMESEGGPDMGVWLRNGDGRCFFPRVRVNTHTDVATPLLAAHSGGEKFMVHWRDYLGGVTPVYGILCGGTATAIGGDGPSLVLSSDLRCTPNPFNPSTVLSFDLWREGQTKLLVYDARGRIVRTLLNELLSAGEHDVPWNGRDDRGIELGSGVYFGRLIRPGGESSIVKVTLLK